MTQLSAAPAPTELASFGNANGVGEHNQQPTALLSPLGMSQENARSYLDTELRRLDSDWKKRSVPASPASTLEQYIDRAHRLLAFTLQMHPTGARAWMRTDFLLRLTGDALKSVPRYPCPPLSLRDSTSEDTEDVGLLKLFAFLDTLDKGWVAVLRGQKWDMERNEGVDATSAGAAQAGRMSQTERTRVRSMLLNDTTPLEVWLAGEGDDGMADGPGEGKGERMLVLERLGLNDLFSDTLGELQVLSGMVVSEGGEATMR